MKTQFASVVVCLALLTCFAFADGTQSEPSNANAGIATLDQAVDRRLSADSLQDLSEVASLVERAQREGLSGEYAKFAEDLLASASLQRGTALGRSIVEVLDRLSSPPSEWPEGWEEQRDIAIAALRKGLAKLSNESGAWFILAQLLMLPGGNIDEAKVALEHAVKGDDAEVRYKALIRQATLTEDTDEQGKLLDAAEETAASVGQENADEILAIRAKWLGSVGRWDEATEVVKKLLDVAPDNLKAVDLAINVFIAGKRYDDALNVVAVMEQRIPNNAGVLLIKASILGAKKTEADTAAALAIYNKLREQNPTDPRFLLVRGQFHLEHKSFDLALKDAEAALRLKSDLGEAILLKYRVFLTQKDYTAAEEALDALSKLADSSIVLELERATLYNLSKRSRKGLEIVDGLLEVTPDLLPALQVKGQIMISLGRHREAVDVLNKVIELDATQAVALNNLAWLLATSPEDGVRDGKRALELATKAAEMTNYKEAFILSTLGAAYAETGDFASAIKWCDECLKLAEADGDDRLDDMRRERESYEKKEPFRERVEEE
ncbi:MAG: tetratricopeptide repeat protein [Thermoguttaceae bacterium]